MKDNRHIPPCPLCGCADVRNIDPDRDDFYVWCGNTECALYDVEIHVDAWSKRPTYTGMQSNTRALLERCIEEGIRAGYARAHKHTSTPRPEDIEREVDAYIWLEIDTYFKFENQE